MYARIIRFSLESTPLFENMKSLVETFNAVLKRKTTERKQNIDVIADIATNQIRPSPRDAVKTLHMLYTFDCKTVSFFSIDRSRVLLRPPPNIIITCTQTFYF